MTKPYSPNTKKKGPNEHVRKGQKKGLAEEAKGQRKARLKKPGHSHRGGLSTRSRTSQGGECELTFPLRHCRDTKTDH
jgi:hypothetical protein